MYNFNYNMSNQCCVCLETPKYPVTLKCNHTLCYICAKFVKENSGCCPLCRDTITEALDKLSLTDISATIQKQTNFPCAQWLFSSRDGRSWWYYDDEVISQIEHYYQNWNEQMAHHQNNLQSDQSDSESDSDEANDVQLPKIHVGPNEYTIDFENMCQTGNMRSRKILRKVFLNQAEKDNFDKTIRGVVGIYFEKK